MLRCPRAGRPTIAAARMCLQNRENCAAGGATHPANESKSIIVEFVFCHVAASGPAAAANGFCGGFAQTDGPADGPPGVCCMPAPVYD